ncbi:MAG: deoxyribodipyrimidine photo-lyase [Thermoleophilia bacterium]
MPGTTLVWLRHDLRLADNPALVAAGRRGGPVVPVVVWAPEEEGDWAPGGASRWWLHRSLAALAADLEARGSRLVLRRGPTLAALRELAAETGAEAVLWNRRYEPAAIARDAAVKEALRADGLVAGSANAALLVEPWTIATRAGAPFQVFTPFWKAVLAAGAPPEPEPAPATLPRPDAWPVSLPLDALALDPTIDWDAGLRATWTPGEAGAHVRLARVLDGILDGYRARRDRPDVDGTTRLSPHLHHGEIGPRQVWHAVADAVAAGASASSAEKLLAELGWREFSYHLLYHVPRTPLEPLRERFAAFPWADDPAGLVAWQRGRTGYPIVDAGMRQLWQTGWLHNRVRMIVASFLVKDLLLPWQEGARWFWDTLVDADLAANTQGWQWTAGCGADAAPYFRVFNPVLQGRKFDPDGAYVRRYVPELAGLDASRIHAPWEAPAADLRAAGVELGATYPGRVVDHGEARTRALAALAEVSEPG